MTQGKGEISQTTVFATMWIPVLTFGALLTIPSFIEILGKHYGVDEAALGRLAAAEFLACIVGTYITNNRSVDQLAHWAPWACVLALAANIVGLALISHVPLILIHPLGALGAGISYGYALKVIDASGKQERNFGIFLATLNLCMLGAFQLIAVLTSRYTPAIFYIYMSFAAIALVISLVTKHSIARLTQPEPIVAQKLAADKKKRGRKLSATVLFSVIAIGISYVAYGIIWPFVQLVGVGRGFSPQDVANGLSAYAITGIMGGLAAAGLPPRVHRPTLLVFALLALLASIYMMYGPSPYALFFIGCAIFGFYWSFYFTLHLGIIAQADSSGRGIVLCGVAPSLGTVLGSFLGGLLINPGDYYPLAHTGTALAIVGMGCALITITRMKPVSETMTTASVPS